MKKVLILGLSLVATIVLASCSKNEKEQSAGSSGSVDTSETSRSTSQTSTTAQATSTTISRVEESTSVEAPAPVLSMDLDQIRGGDYSSIAGTWKNELGRTITVEGNTLSISGLETDGQMATLVGQILDIPEKNNPDGSVKIGQAQGTPLPEYTKQMEPEENQGYFSLRSSMPNAAVYISFLPKGVPLDLPGGELGQDRIVAIGTQNTATSVPPQYVYYKVQ